MTVFIHKQRDLVTPWLFVLQFISIKNKIVNCILDESYHNTSIYLIIKQNITILYN